MLLVYRDTRKSNRVEPHLDPRCQEPVDKSGAGGGTRLYVLCVCVARKYVDLVLAARCWSLVEWSNGRRCEVL